MKILWFKRHVDLTKRGHASTRGMPYALEKFADVKFYGPGFPGGPSIRSLREGVKIDVPKVIKKLYGRDYHDVVIQNLPSFHIFKIWRRRGVGLFPVLKNFHLAKCLRVMWSGDIWLTMRMPKVVRFLKMRRVDLIIKFVDAYDQLVHSKKLAGFGIPVEWCPPSIDPSVFYDRKLPKKYDVANIGAKPPAIYPLRFKVHHILRRQKEIKYFSQHVWGKNYAKIINESKMFVTGASKHKCLMNKMFEVMACNTLLVCNIPREAAALGLKPHFHFSVIDYDPKKTRRAPTEKFMVPIQYWLKHPLEAAKIAQRGHDLVHSRHTHDIRMKKFVATLSKYLS